MNYVKEQIKLEKQAIKEMDWREKTKYYLSKKSTWLTLGATITAVASGDPMTAFNTVISFVMEF